MSDNSQDTDCQVMRRKLKRTYTVTLGTCQEKDHKETWVDEKCGSPLWSDEERKSGECKSCKSGWTHKNNYRIDVKLKTAKEVKDNDTIY